MDDPLNDIFTSEQEINPEALASILKPFLRINIESNSIFFTDEASNLSITSKVLLFLVARKALKFKNKIEAEETTPAEIISETGLKDGSVHPALKYLREKGLVISKGGKYFTANYQLAKIKKHLLSKEKNGT